MNNKLKRFIEFINENAEYQEAWLDDTDGEEEHYNVDLYEETLLKEGFHLEDITKFLRQLKNEGLIEYMTTLAGRGKTPTSFDPDKDVVGSIHANEEFPRIYHTLYLNKNKFDEYGFHKPNDSFSSDTSNAGLKKRYEPNKQIRRKDWEVLKLLDDAQGQIVKRLELALVLKGTPFDEEEASDDELNLSIHRLRKYLKIKIELEKGIGYKLLQEPTLQKKS